MTSGTPHPEHIRVARAPLTNRNITLAVLTIVGLLVVVAVGSGLIGEIQAKVGLRVIAPLLVGTATALALVIYSVCNRREDGISTAAKLTGGAVIISVASAITTVALNPGAITAIVVGAPLALVIIGCGAFAARRARPTVFGIPAAGYGLAAWLAAPLAAGWIWYVFAGPGYYAEFNHLKARLGEIPGVEVIRMGGNRDLTYEDLWAHLRVKGKGDITLIALTAPSLSESAELHLSKIGPYSFRNERWGYGAVIDRDGKQVWHQSIGFTLNVGSGGEFRPGGRLEGRLPGKIRNVQEVIQRYDDIIAAVASLQGEKLFFRNDDGSTIEYTIRR